MSFLYNVENMYELIGSLFSFKFILISFYAQAWLPNYNVIQFYLLSCTGIYKIIDIKTETE